VSDNDGDVDPRSIAKDSPWLNLGRGLLLDRPLMRSSALWGGGSKFEADIRAYLSGSAGSDGVYIDRAHASDLPLSDSEAEESHASRFRRGDHVIVAGSTARSVVVKASQGVLDAWSSEVSAANFATCVVRHRRATRTCGRVRIKIPSSSRTLAADDRDCRTRQGLAGL